MQQQPQRRLTLRSARRQRDAGYLLLAVMLMMAFLIVAATYVVAPRFVQQMKRDREEEMIHRGTEYARAVKKFYKKNGRYPASLDDLDKGQIRFLRKRYKDPLSKDGQWKLLRYGDIATLLNTAAPGVPVSGLGQGGAVGPGGIVVPGNLPPNLQRFGSPQSGGGFSVGSGSNPGTIIGSPTSSPVGGNPGTVTGFPTSSDQGGNPEGAPTGVNNSSSGDQQSGSAFGQNPTNDNQSFGGGAIVGVGSLSKDPTIRIYNKKKTYNEWQFIYNPIMDQQQGLLRGPYQPTTISNTNIGTPADQLNQQQQQNSPFGQPNSGFGQQPGIGQPGNKYPPDQNQPQ